VKNVVFQHYGNGAALPAFRAVGGDQIAETVQTSVPIPHIIRRHHARDFITLGAEAAPTVPSAAAPAHFFAGTSIVGANQSVQGRADP
jgi:hypothetical protein